MRFAEYLQEVLALPAAVYESPSFSYSESLATSIFSGVSLPATPPLELPLTVLCLQATKVTVNDFMDMMMSDPGPHCLVWLPLLHRLASVENGEHGGWMSINLNFGITNLTARYLQTAGIFCILLRKMISNYSYY